MKTQTQTPQELTKWIGSTVREYRQKKNMTQLELSEKLGAGSMMFVSLFERGQSKIPLKTLGRLIVILELPEKQILKRITETHAASVQNQINEGKK